MRACPNSGKASFPSKKKADKTLKAINGRVNKRSALVEMRTLTRSYECPICENWHHTTQ